MVYAGHTRRNVIEICEKELNEIRRREERQANDIEDNEGMQNQRADNNTQKFWVFVNKAEAHFALGEFEDYKRAVDFARLIEHKPWMMDSFEEQVAKLRILLERNGHLLNPAWKEIG